MIFQNEQEVIDLLTPIVELYKKADVKLKYDKFDLKAEEMPDFYPNYKLAVSYADRIRIHSETGTFPESLFKNRHPNQKKAEYKYMKDNYKQDTLPVFIDFISTNTRPLSKGNWNIEYQDQGETFKDQSFQHYVENEIEVVGSMEEYLKTMLPSLKGVDANGVVLIKPQEVYTVTDGEEVFMDDVKLVRPQPYFYPCKNVLSDPIYDDDYFILECVEKSVVDYNGIKTKAGHIFEVVDEQNIWRVEQTGKYSDYSFTVTLYFAHGEGKIPAQRLKGIPQIVGDSYVWQSQFLYACDLLDLALMNANYLQCSIANKMFPYTVMLGNKCKYKQADDQGNTYTCEDGNLFSGGKYIECPACHGSGLRDRLSPLGIMLLNPADMNSGSDGDAKFTGKALEHITPDTNASEFVLKKIERDTSKAYEVIKVRRLSTSKAEGINPTDGTATGEILDVKAQWGSVMLFNGQLFSVFESLINSIGWQRYGKSFNKPVINKPNSVDFNTELDYLNRIKMAKEANLPPTIINNLIVQYLQSIYFSEKKTANIFNLLFDADRLFVLTQDEVLIKLARGLVAPWEVVLHDSGMQFIDRLIAEYADVEMCDIDDCSRGFFALDFDEQVRLLQEMAKKEYEAIKTVSPAGTSLVDQAKNKLLGVQGGDAGIGKLPLALQQMTNAIIDAEAIGNKKLSNAMQNKAIQITGQIE